MGLAAACSLCACSVVYSPAPARQCSTDADCDAEPELSGRVCDVEHGLCVEPTSFAVDTTPEAGCASDEACTIQSDGNPALCRTPGTPCVPLATSICPRVSANWQAPNALFLGSIGPHSQRLAVLRDILRNPYAERLLDAIDLGASEWAEQRPSGLSFSGRPIATIHCDSAGDLRQAQAAMAHLVNVVEAPLVLALGDLDLAAVTDQAVEAQTALLCVGCYARSTESSFDEGLIWRLQPALEAQASMAAWRVKDLEQRLRAERGLAVDSDIRVALLTQDYPGITAFRERSRSLLVFNRGKSASENGSSFFELQTPDPSREAVDQTQIALRVAQFQPDIIVVGIDSDFTTYYLRMIEDAWGASARPYYVATSMNEELGLLEPIVGADDDLRQRLGGTTLFVDAPVAANAAAFAERFSRQYGQAPDNVQFGYDAFYAAAFALVTADRERRFDGGTVALGLGSLSGGPRVDVGPMAIASGVAYLLDEQSIDLVGASTLLDWDPTRREVSSDVGLWCLTRTIDGKLALERDPGVRWQAEFGIITGTYTCD